MIQNVSALFFLFRIYTKLWNTDCPVFRHNEQDNQKLHEYHNYVIYLPPTTYT